jgi:hypothetical protein
MLLKIYFLKKKKFIIGSNEILLYNVEKGSLFSFEYMSLDRDSIFKYKLSGLCVGLKKKYIMSSFYFNSVYEHVKLTGIFHRYSPFIYNILPIKFLSLLRSKNYNLMVKLKT